MIKRIKKHLKELIELKTSPHSIAAGFALGTFIAILPTFGLGIFIGLGLLLFLKKVSKISMFISFAVWNPLVLALMYPLNYKMGDYILLDIPVKAYKIELLNQLFVYSRRFLVGSAINAIIISIVCYILVLYFTYKFQRKRLMGLRDEIVKLEETLRV
ncbi:MAG: DUF2062 domain-containing protein [archaeon]